MEIAQGTLLKWNGCRRIYTNKHTRSPAHACTYTHSCFDKPISTPLFFCLKRTILKTHTQLSMYFLHFSIHCGNSWSAFLPKAQTCKNALRVFHRLSSYFINSLWINTNRVDKCIDVGTNACLCVTFYRTLPSYFWQTCLIILECARWSLGYLYSLQKLLHALSLSDSLCLLYSRSALSLPHWDAHTREQEGRALIHFH